MTTGEGTVAADFVRDESHWLRKLSPREWIHAAQAELARAEGAYGRRDPRAGLAGARRAAGMALNGALLCEPNEAWGRSYVDHLRAVGRDAALPARVQEAARELVSAPMPGQQGLVSLRTNAGDERVLEAARDLIAHAFAVVMRHEGLS